jgi:IS30 family transposase
MLVPLPDGHDAEAVRDGLIATIGALPAHLRGSLTRDQGAEMARHKQFSMATDMAVYFCDPASPGNAAPMRTPMDYCASTSQKAPT